MTEHQPAAKGDMFEAPGGIVRVTRRSRRDLWVDVVVIATDGAVWTKRMPLGIPAAWPRLPRR